MGRHDVAYRDPTGNQAVSRVMREHEAHADLGLGYPPDDDTEDLVGVAEVPRFQTGEVPDFKSARVAFEAQPLAAFETRARFRSEIETHPSASETQKANSKKPPVSSDQELTEGVQTDHQQEEDLP
ncbi:hypothetical protein nbrc107696_15730 [Gordonia spumicola]|uniref:Uncharacterized protein n=1 Tax=Gordonia spumicola TaxID=589161 RepID=A0A7I9V750_9ACTN|nr:hypothetical protein [Gordonia spumicola]GEE01127.1 hypothetical protein nbrc107696_15730 [Gordonia spumicola]